VNPLIEIPNVAPAIWVFYRERIMSLLKSTLKADACSTNHNGVLPRFPASIFNHEKTRVKHNS